MKQVPEVLFFPEASRYPKRRRRGATGHPHTRVARPSPWPRPLCVRMPRSTSDAATLPIKTPNGKNLSTRSIFQKHIAIRRRRRPEIGMLEIETVRPVPILNKPVLCFSYSLCNMYDSRTTSCNSRYRYYRLPILCNIKSDKPPIENHRRESNFVMVSEPPLP
jgi:hypothetical protein